MWLPHSLGLGLFCSQPLMSRRPSVRRPLRPFLDHDWEGFVHRAYGTQNLFACQERRRRTRKQFEAFKSDNKKKKKKRKSNRVLTL